MQDFRKLQVWEKAHHLTLSVYRASAAFPKEELYGLTCQIRRATASVQAILQKVTGVEEIWNLPAFCELLPVQLMS